MGVINVIGGLVGAGANAFESKKAGDYNRSRQSNNYNLQRSKLALMQQQLAERKREFNETDKLQQQRLALGMGIGQRYQPALLREQAAANQLLQQYGAINQDGTIDVSRLPPAARMQYNQIQLAIQKGGQDAYARKLGNLGANMMTTFNSIDITPLEYYSGVEGKKRLKEDQAKALAGNAPSMYNKYYTLTTNQIPLLVDQINKYMQGSIQPEHINQLKKSLNVDGWTADPQIVAQNFEKAKELFASEYANTLSSLNNPQFYITGQASEPTNPYVPAQQAATTQPNVSRGTNAVVGASGAQYTPQQIAQMAQEYNKTPQEIVQILQEQG